MARIDPGKESILIVDDQDGMVRMVADFLAARQYRILTATNGDEALELFGRHCGIAVVLLGLEAARQDISGTLGRLKSQTPRPNVVVMSGAEDRLAIDEAMRQGAFDYLVKPINTASLEVVLEAALADYEDGGPEG